MCFSAISPLITENSRLYFKYYLLETLLQSYYNYRPNSITEKYEYDDNINSYVGQIKSHNHCTYTVRHIA